SSNAGRPSGGSSAAGSGAGGSDPAPYDPCAGKACGDLCSLCDPAEPNCVEPTVIMTCTATGQCSVGRPACTVPECEGTQQYYAPGCDQLARPDPNALLPFEPGCY